MGSKRASRRVGKDGELVKVRVGSDEAREMMKRVATRSFETPFLPSLPN